VELVVLVETQALAKAALEQEEVAPQVERELRVAVPAVQVERREASAAQVE
jgi:hypothetical protein